MDSYKILYRQYLSLSFLKSLDDITDYLEDISVSVNNSDKEQ